MRKAARYLLATLAFNTAIAAVLSALMPGEAFSHQLIYAHCIGLSIALIMSTTANWTPPGRTRLVLLILSLPISVAVGLAIAQAVSGNHPNESHDWQGMAAGLFFGAIGAIVFLLSERLANEVRQKQLIRSEGERRAVEAQLKLLQAQIEPHFLFNTLANVSSLIDSDPTLAKHLLEKLNDWLRVALARARNDSAHLGDELDMLDHYLQIMKIRFGDRLNWYLDIQDEARRLPFPPMLLQPLVENAVRHGIELSVAGGTIRIGSRVETDRLCIDVADTGIGLAGPPGHPANATAGTGLGNVRARLDALYGGAASLTLQSNADGGATAILTLPLQELAP